MPTAIATGNYPGNQLPTFGRSPPSMPHPSPALNLTPPRLPVFTPVVSMEVLHYFQEVPMATDTLTKPVIDGGTTTTKVFRNFIDGEWVESTSGQTFEDRNPA